jgi:hypothetical protein
VSSDFGSGLESAYAVFVPSLKEEMAKRYFEREGPAPGAGKLPPNPRAKPQSRRKRTRIWKDTQNRIREIIEEWPHPTIDWDSVIPVANNEFKANWIRQSLQRHPRLLKAFQDRKAELKRLAEAAGATAKRKDSDVEYLDGQVRELEEANAGLKARLVEYEARFARWQRNAYLHGLSVEQLDAPLQENDRGRDRP